MTIALARLRGFSKPRCTKAKYGPKNALARLDVSRGMSSPTSDEPRNYRVNLESFSTHCEVIGRLSGPNSSMHSPI